GAVGAVTVGVTLISMLCVGAASVTETEARAVDRVAPVDVVVSGRAIPSVLVQRLRRLDEVVDVAVLRGGVVRTATGTVQVATLSKAAAGVVVRDSGLRSELANPATVVVPVGAQAQLPGAEPARVVLRGPSGTVRVDTVYSSLQSGPLLVAPGVLRK